MPPARHAVVCQQTRPHYFKKPPKPAETRPENIDAQTPEEANLETPTSVEAPHYHRNHTDHEPKPIERSTANITSNDSTNRLESHLQRDVAYKHTSSTISKKETRLASHRLTNQGLSRSNIGLFCRHSYDENYWKSLKTHYYMAKQGIICHPKDKFSELRPSRQKGNT